MKKIFRLLVSSSAVAALLVLSGTASGFQAKKDKTAPAATTPAPGAPSDQDIADAKTKGLVWVNTSSKVYHKDGEFYGKTKQGKFMAEPDAQKAGFRAAKEPQVGKKKTPPADTKK